MIIIIIIQLITKCNKLTRDFQEMFAVCLLDNGEYGVLSYDQNSEGDDLLCFSTIVDQDKMPLIIPHFSQVISPPDKHIYIYIYIIIYKYVLAVISREPCLE